jgi:hypothetical protein
MPGVSSPGLTVHCMSEKSASVYRARAESHRDEDGISEWVGQSRRLGDDMMRMHLSSVCAVSRKTKWILNGRALHESE